MVTTDAQRMMAACHLAIADLRDVVTQLPPQQPDGRADAAAVAKVSRSSATIYAGGVI